MRTLARLRHVTLALAAIVSFPSASLAASETLLWLSKKNGDIYDGSYYGGAYGAELLIDNSGALYGTSSAGGRWGGGAVFKLIPPQVSPPPGYSSTDWIEYILYDLPSSSPGYAYTSAVRNIAFDGAGGLFGVAALGGANNRGYAFTLSPLPAGQTPSPTPPHAPPLSSERYWQPNVVYHFSSTSLGNTPRSIAAAPGGGYYVAGSAGVSKLTPPASGATFVETPIYGSNFVAGVTPDAMGALYVTTYYGGLYGKGEVFKLTAPPTAGTPWVKTSLYSFPGGAQGGAPQSPPTLGLDGAIYGVAYEGGPANAGLVYSLTPLPAGGYQKSTLYAFGGAVDGAKPFGRVVLDNFGALYGVTTTGGAYGGGTAFQLTGSNALGWQKTTLYSFAAPNGVTPMAGMTFGARGALYGTLEHTQSWGGGGVFQLQLP